MDWEGVIGFLNSEHDRLVGLAKLLPEDMKMKGETYNLALIIHIAAKALQAGVKKEIA